MPDITQTCRITGKPFVITEEDQKFYEKIKVPLPTLSPEERQRRRHAFRNERNLYQSTCYNCKKSIISMYSPDKEYVVYCPDCWWSDSFDPLVYGQDFDFNKSFFEQFHELKKKVPHLALDVVNNENSDYVNLCGYSKDCYLIFAAEYDERCLYGTQMIKCNDCIDGLNCLNSQYCYDVLNIDGCYELLFGKDCYQCSNSMFLWNCRSCKECLFCSNISNKKYCIFNKQYSVEEYKVKKQEILQMLQEGKLEELKAQMKQFSQQQPQRFAKMVNCENCLGDYLVNCKNCKSCYDLSDAEDCSYVYTGFKVKSLMDVCHTTEGEWGYEAMSFGYHSNNVLFCNGAWGSHDAYYVYLIKSSSNVFGCIGLKRNKYCILNKQYTKEQYEVLVPKIIEHMKSIGEWGEYFPVWLSPFAYNETLAQEYMPLSKEQVLQRNYKWKEKDPKEYQKQTCQVSSNIKEVLDNIIQEILACKNCGKNYRITKQELDFYRKLQLPIPSKCPDCRHTERMQLKNPRELWNRKCVKCSLDITTTYSPDKPEMIYCEKCYLAQMD